MRYIIFKVPRDNGEVILESDSIDEILEKWHELLGSEDNWGISKIDRDYEPHISFQKQLGYCVLHAVSSTCEDPTSYYVLYTPEWSAIQKKIFKEYINI